MDDIRAGSALLVFEGENVRSFAEPFELSLEATTLSLPNVARPLRKNMKGGTVGVLPAAGIFGANASGKSNVLRSLSEMRQLVRLSFRSGRPGGGVPRRPFTLDDEWTAKPSRYEVELVLNGIRWRYGFEFDSQRILREWADRWPKGAQARVFERIGDGIRHGSGLATVGRRVESLLRPNALFLSTAAQAGHPELTPLFEWFDRNLLLAEASSRPWRHLLTAELWSDERFKNTVRDLVRAADLGITDVQRAILDPEQRGRIEEAMRVLTGDVPDSEAMEFVPDPGLRLVHGRSVVMEAEDESLGTLVWLGLVGPVVEALAQGSVLLADELDASLHPSLVQRIVALFQDLETNPKCAQLIFNAHDVTLLGDSQEHPLGRDQIWFTTKDSAGRTRLYPLTEFKPRKEESVARKYMSGYYGAHPMLAAGDFAAALEQVMQ